MAKKKIKDLTIADLHKVCVKQEYCDNCPLCCYQGQCVGCFFDLITEEDMEREIEVEENGN